MKAFWSVSLIVSMYALSPSAAQENREAYLTGLRAAVKNPADSQDVYRRVIKPEFREILVDAAQNGNQELVVEMLSAYFDGNRSHDSALGLAILFRDAEIVKALLKHGADCKTANDEQRTPLHHAAADGTRSEMISLLLEKGADPNARSFVGTTPLMLAAENSARRNVITLLLAGAKVNARNNDGETALMLAVKGNGSETVRVLLEAGANPRLKDDRGRLASDFLVNETFVPQDFSQYASGFTSDERRAEITQEQRAERQKIVQLLKAAMTPSLRTLAVSLDGKILVSGDINGEVQLWDIQTGKKRQTLIPNEKIIALALSPDGKQLAVGCERREVQIWNKRADGFYKTRSLELPSVASLAFSPQGKTLAIGCYGYGTITLCNPVTGSVQGKVWEASKGVTALAFSPVGRRLLSGGVNTKLWDMRPESKAWSDEANFIVAGKSVVPETALIWNAAIEGDATAKVVFASHGMLAAGVGGTGEGGKTLKIWDAIRGKTKQTITKPEMTSLTFLPNNQKIVTGTKQGELILWNVETGAKLFQTRLSSSPIRAMSIIPSTPWIAIGCEDGSLLIWDTVTKTTKQPLIKASH